MHRLMIAPAVVIALGARIQAQCVGRNKRSALRRSCVAEVTDGVISAAGLGDYSRRHITVKR